MAFTHCVLNFNPTMLQQFPLYLTQKAEPSYLCLLSCYSAGVMPPDLEKKKGKKKKSRWLMDPSSCLKPKYVWSLHSWGPNRNLQNRTNIFRLKISPALNGKGPLAIGCLITLNSYVPYLCMFSTVRFQEHREHGVEHIKKRQSFVICTSVHLLSLYMCPCGSKTRMRNTIYTLYTFTPHALYKIILYVMSM